MVTFLHTLTGVAIVAVFVVLVLGVLNMMRGSSPNRSQMLMRLRVILQFTAIVVMMAALYFTRR
jgi:cytochrome bd-type quinol oxidase subunit 1